MREVAGGIGRYPTGSLFLFRAYVAVMGYFIRNRNHSGTFKEYVPVKKSFTPLVFLYVFLVTVVNTKGVFPFLTKGEFPGDSPTPISEEL